VEGLRLENKALKDRLDIHEQERLGVEENSRKNKDQLHDMAQMVSSPGGPADIRRWECRIFIYRLPNTLHSRSPVLISPTGLSVVEQSQPFRVAQVRARGIHAH